MSVLLLDEGEVRSLITPREARTAVRDAFRRLAEGAAIQPPSFDLDVPAVRGELHVKGAYVQGLPRFAIKVASGFYGNAARGLPVSNGLSLVFGADTGALQALILDGGWLTELRTAAAGALAAELLAPANTDVIGILGAGGQARFQLEALLALRRPREVLVWSRRLDAAQAYAKEMSAAHGLPVRALDTAEAVVRAARLIVTCTPAREPIVRSEWVQPGTHITAMGSDLAGKQELDTRLLARADAVVADEKANCLRSGEIGCAVRAGVLDAGRIVELGAIVAGRAAGRRNAADITIADECGLGICDTAVANFVIEAAFQRGIGRSISP